MAAQDKPITQADLDDAVEELVSRIYTGQGNLKVQIDDLDKALDARMDILELRLTDVLQLEEKVTRVLEDMARLMNAMTEQVKEQARRIVQVEERVKKLEEAVLA